MEPTVRVTPDKVEGISTLAQLECALSRPDWNDVQILKIKNVNLSQLSVPLVFPTEALAIELKDCSLPVCPPLPKKLLELRLDRNAGITELPELPPRLQKLFCRRTGLTHLPELPESLQVLGVNDCALQDTPARPAIPNFPDSLYYIDITRNQVQRIPPLPRYLHTGVFSHNQISEADFEDVIVEGYERLRIFFDNNQFTQIPLPLPRNVGVDTFANNPLNEPFAGLYATYTAAGWQGEAAFRQAMGQLAQQLEAQEEAREAARNLAAAQALRAPVEHNTGANWYYGPKTTQVPTQGPLNVIASFLTGKSGTQKQQASQLREFVSRPLGAPGAQGGRRRTRRKGRKGKRSSTR